MSFGKPQAASRHQFSLVRAGCHILAFAFMACLAAYMPLLASQPEMVMIEGRVVADEGPLSADDVSISVNGQKLGAQDDGRYAGRVVQADIYQLRFDSRSLFTGIYTFAQTELQRSDNGHYIVPKIELVARKPGRVEMIFGGDVMMGRRYEKPSFRASPLIRPASRASDMQALLAPMAPYLQASDFAAVNLETIVSASKPAQRAPKSITFYSHPDSAAALKNAGIDYVTLGNNHIYDYLDVGLESTTAALDAAGLLYSGAGRRAEQALKAAQIDIGGHDYSMLGFVGWAGRVSPNQVAGKDKGGAAHGSAGNIGRAVKRESAAGRIAVVQYHGSREYSDSPTEITQSRLRTAVDAGADLVVAHHPHVTHGLEIYQGKLIAYSLGNFVFDQYFFEAQLAYVLKVWMDGDQFYRAEAIPVQLLDYRPVPAVAGMREGVLRRLFSQSRALGTEMSMSGGHGVISNKAHISGSPAPACPVAETAENGMWRLPFDLEQGPVSCAGQDIGNLAAAKDIWHRGDFEAARYEDAVDQSWEVRNAEAALSQDSRSGRYALALQKRPGGDEVAIMPRTFLRVLEGSAYSVAGWIRADAPLQLSLSLQSRSPGVGRFLSLKEAEWKAAGSKAIAAGSWQHFRFDFPPPRTAKGKPLPTRPILQMKGDGEGAILLDDFVVIEQSEPDSSAGADDPLRQNFWIDGPAR
ncbi:CapA family protein [Sphingorhabdus sp. YGSMI21]|uniref:CapA family protein n=1 Tax=Sphingorhabdus sp. YGSMI21 TaxID=2077182 RepID=UPI0013DCB9EF|nr:CapA family protein [Sphingorhabdus sp. YGSMI21]